MTVQILELAELGRGKSQEISRVKRFFGATP